VADKAALRHVSVKPRFASQHLARLEFGFYGGARSDGGAIRR
jgi:hypothetical protein